MYEKNVPYKNYKGQPKNKMVQMYLEERDIFKLSPELSMIFDWRDEMRREEVRDLDPQEVIPYFTAFEEVLLSSYGEMSADGEEFKRGNRYDFSESACFNALLMMFVRDPAMIVEFLENTIPEGMEDLVREQAENIKKLEEAHPEIAGQTPAQLQAEIERLRAKVGEDAADSQPPAN